jgi:transglutaminase-like putative cysteine protease
MKVAHMAKRLTVRHRTTYSYSAPVEFGEHRMLLRPRDSHDLRLVDARLTLSPGASVRWAHDVFGNSVAFMTFEEPAEELLVESVLVLDRFALEGRELPLEPGAERYPFIYSADDRADLGRLLELQYPDPKGELSQWAKGFVAGDVTDTRALLADINSSIHQGFTYGARHDEGTQPPLETLSLGTGTCRDFALLMMEALRSLGFATRFVSGYLYDPALDTAGDAGIQGSGATHAWLEVYLPGAGWVEYDPTNGLVGSNALIRVAVTRDPSQAIPISGSYSGPSGAFLGMEVSVEVTSGDPAPDTSDGEDVPVPAGEAADRAVPAAAA